MKVIVAIDDSAYSERVIETISKRKWPADTEFRVLTVLEDFPDMDFEERMESAVAEAIGTREKFASDYCEKARESLEQAIPKSRVHFEVREGKPKAEIIDSAVEWGADRIIIGAHGTGICPRFFIGSVSRAVVKHAPCSVDVVRPKISKEDLEKMAGSSRGKEVPLSG